MDGNSDKNSMNPNNNNNNNNSTSRNIHETWTATAIRTASTSNPCLSESLVISPRWSHLRWKTVAPARVDVRASGQVKIVIIIAIIIIVATIIIINNTIITNGDSPLDQWMSA